MGSHNVPTWFIIAALLTWLAPWLISWAIIEWISKVKARKMHNQARILANMVHSLPDEKRIAGIMIYYKWCLKSEIPFTEAKAKIEKLLKESTTPHNALRSNSVLPHKDLQECGK